MARPLTKPSITGCGTSRMNLPSFSTPAASCRTPITTTAANRYSMPCSATRLTITTASAPVAPEIIPGRPAERRGDQSDDERGIEPDQRRHSGDEGKRHRLGHQRQRHGQAGKDLDADPAGVEIASERRESVGEARHQRLGQGASPGLVSQGSADP